MHEMQDYTDERMGSAVFLTTVTRDAQGVTLRLVDFPEVKSQGATLEEAATHLSKELQRVIAAHVEEHNALPQPQATESPGETLQTPFPDAEFVEKASEKLLEFTKAEFDRVNASAKLAEERAKQNGAYALAALPILSFIRPDQPTLLYGLLQALALALVIVIMVLVGAALKSRSLTGIGLPPQDLRQERDITHAGYRPYRDLLYILQTAWIKSTETTREARDARFNLVDWQHRLLVPLVVLLGLLLILPMTGW